MFRMGNPFLHIAEKGFLSVHGGTAMQTEERMEDRIGVIGIVIDDPAQAGEMVNHQISRSVSIIRGRMGLPGTEGESSVIALVVAGTTDEIGALTGRLGNIKGVRVKSALAGK